MMTQDATVTNLVKTAFKLAPQHFKVRMLLDRAAQEIGTRMNTSPKVTEEGQAYLYDDVMCPYCIDWKNDKPVCFTVAGFLGEVLRHIGNIDNAKIEEITCRSQGDASCRFRVTIP